MFRRILHMTQNGNGTVLDEAGPDLTNGSTNQIRRRSLSSALPKPARVAALGQFDTFDEIYQSAPASTPEGSYSILKVGEMVRSSHLVGMSMESKRSALMMALEAAGVDVKDLLQDAMLRQRALNDYEETQLKLLREFETVKTEENRRIQSELEAVTAQYMARIQSNVDEVAAQQDSFRNWQKTKAQEAAAISEATTYCQVPDNTLDNLTVALERSGSRR